MSAAKGEGGGVAYQKFGKIALFWVFQIKIKEYSISNFNHINLFKSYI